MDFEKPEPAERGDDRSVDLTKSTRRSFIAGCVAICGGTIAYLTPSVKAYAATNSISSPGPVFDITLPTSYSVGGAPFSVTFSIPGHAALPVDFTPGGQLTLVASAVPRVANVMSNVVTVSSVSNNPLLPAGENCGPVTMTIPSGRMMGSLNLDTGVFTPADFLVNATTNCDTQNNISLHQTRGSVINTTFGLAPCTCNTTHEVTISALAFNSGVGSVTGSYAGQATSIPPSGR